MILSGCRKGGKKTAVTSETKGLFARSGGVINFPCTLLQRQERADKVNLFFFTFGARRMNAWTRILLSHRAQTNLVHKCTQKRSPQCTKVLCHAGAAMPLAGYAYAQKRIRPFPLPRRGILAVLHNKIQLCLIACEMNGGFKCAFRNDF